MKLKNNKSSIGSKKQKGVILLFSLIFLTVLTLIAVGGMESSVMEERMAGNMQDYNAAFQAAESSLGVAEGWLQGQTFLPPASSNGVGTVVWNPGSPNNASDNWWEVASGTWWGDNADQLAAPNLLNTVPVQPHYVIEQFYTSTVGQSLAIGTGQVTNTRVVHRITAQGAGNSRASQVMLQSTYIRPYD